MTNLPVLPLALIREAPLEVAWCFTLFVLYDVPMRGEER